MTNFWEDVRDDLDGVSDQKDFLRAKVASAAFWPYLALASSEAEFEGRLDYTQERIRTTAGSHFNKVVGSLREDFKTLSEERLAAKEASVSALAHAVAAKALPIPHVQVTAHKGFYQVDHVASNTLHNNIHKGPDGEQAMVEARKFAQFNGMPVFVNGEPDNEMLHESTIQDHKDHQGNVDDRVTQYYQWAKENGHEPDSSAGLKAYEKQPGISRKHVNEIADQQYIGGGGDDWRKNASVEYFNQAAGRWERVAYNDPTAGYRYHYPDYNPPVDNGPLQGPDGFPIDLAQGEQRTPAAYQRQLTPGQWTDATPWVENDMNLQPGPAAGRNNSGWGAQAPQKTASGDGLGLQQNSTCNRENQLIPSHSWMTDTKNHPEGSKAACPSCGKVVTSQRDGGGALVFKHEPGMHFRLSSVNGGEGIVPTPGQNPNFFDEAQQGLASNPRDGFPMDPSLDEEADNRVNQYGPPPQQSSGSDEGVNGPYSRNLNSEAVRYGPHFNPGRASNVLVYQTGYTHGQEGQGFDNKHSKIDHAKSYAVGYAHGLDDQGLESTASLPQFFDPTQEKTAGKHEAVPEWMGTPDLEEEGEQHAMDDLPPQRNHPDYFRGYARGMDNKLVMRAALAADYRGRPSLEHPNGVGDDYTNKTWDAPAQQRQQQSAEDRGANNPTLPQSPVQVVDTNNPGATNRDDDDEDD